jgi:uncharacterized membrane protein
MIEIIPNWHPIFVNFTVALFTTACGFYLLAYFLSILKTVQLKFKPEIEIVGRWCLWTGCDVFTQRRGRRTLPP